MRVYKRELPAKSRAEPASKIGAASRVDRQRSADAVFEGPFEKAADVGGAVSSEKASTHFKSVQLFLSDFSRKAEYATSAAEVAVILAAVSVGAAAMLDALGDAEETVARDNEPHLPGDENLDGGKDEIEAWPSAMREAFGRIGSQGLDDPDAHLEFVRRQLKAAVA